MPELAEQMYCSQQICIPPTFPYLLRQFAKAAIRTQPNDLLKWSTTYFRCLSLNVPPPVKPRLEYPIPKDFNGLTPGWLKALLHQMEGCQTVTFKTLWDRWIGACLEHPNLVEILCLGNFDDNQAIPWLKFIALCAGHLTENLTQTMILICDLLTEEPEGGSSMISATVFIDLYTFLAGINAAVPQTLKNYYFLDTFLELFEEKIVKDDETKAHEESIKEFSMNTSSSDMTVEEEKTSKASDADTVVSCPSISSQDPDNFIKLLMKIQENVDEEEQENNSAETPKQDKDDKLEKDDDNGKNSDENVANVKEIEFSDKIENEISTSPKGSELLKKEEQEIIESQTQQDLEGLQQEMSGETDEEVEKFKAAILADIPLNVEDTGETESDSIVSREAVQSDASLVSAAAVEEETFVDERKFEEIYVEAVPGIGGKVPENLIDAAIQYIKNVAKSQHGMFMPRNIQHFECPPLEVVNVE